MIAKYEYLTKKEVKNVIQSTINSIKSEGIKTKSIEHISSPVKKRESKIPIGICDFYIKNTAKCKYDLIII